MQVWELRKYMNRRGITILELLISISIVSVVLLMLIELMLNLSKINQDNSYASLDEIQRTEIIKTIEQDFLKLKLQKKNLFMIIKFMN